MANSKVTGLGAITDIAGADVMYVIDAAAADAKILAGNFNLLPDGRLWNGEISPTVSSNNLTLALKDRAGNNASATNPISVFIGGTRRICTAALSVTRNAGTNWANAGASETAAQEIDWFAYLIWNTGPATDILDLGFSRVPYGRVISDFSSTSTNDRYIATANGTPPNSTDECVCIGRFAATLSATPNFNWSVPAYTAANLIQHPIYDTRWLTWTPTPGGFSANPTTTVYSYRIDRHDCILRARQGGNGTSNATTFTLTSPITAQTVTNGVWHAPGQIIDNGTAGASPGLITIASAATTINLFKDYSAAVWTGSGGKRVNYFELRFPLG